MADEVWIWVVMKFQFEGLHYWKDAPPQVHYLAFKHRHIFHVEARMTVRHNDREVEFIQAKNHLLGQVNIVYDWGPKSCEGIAEAIIALMQAKWGRDRDYSVEVLEDGENGAIVTRVAV